MVIGHIWYLIGTRDASFFKDSPSRVLVFIVSVSHILCWFRCGKCGGIRVAPESNIHGSSLASCPQLSLITHQSSDSDVPEALSYGICNWYLDTQLPCSGRCSFLCNRDFCDIHISPSYCATSWLQPCYSCSPFLPTLSTMSLHSLSSENTYHSFVSSLDRHFATPGNATPRSGPLPASPPSDTMNDAANAADSDDNSTADLESAAAATEFLSSPSNSEVISADPTDSSPSAAKQGEATSPPTSYSFEEPKEGLDVPDSGSDFVIPDGGLRAWLVVLGSFINYATVFGTAITPASQRSAPSIFKRKC